MLAGAVIGTIGVIEPEFRVAVQQGQRVFQRSQVARAEIERRIIPDFAEARYIVGHDGTARECGLQRSKAEGLVF